MQRSRNNLEIIDILMHMGWGMKRRQCSVFLQAKKKGGEQADWGGDGSSPKSCGWGGRFTPLAPPLFNSCGGCPINPRSVSITLFAGV